MGRIQNRDRSKRLVALITNHCDDVYCFRRELLQGFQKAGFQLLISCPDGDKFSLIDDELDYLYDDPEIDRRGTSVISDFRLMLHYGRLLKTYQPDVVLCYTIKPNVYASIMAARYKIPYINNITGLGSLINQGNLMRNFVLGLYRIALRWSACVMFQNEENMQFARKKKLVHGNHRRIPGSGVNTDHFFLQPFPDAGNGLTGESVVFCYIGRILKEKGIDDYLEAAQRIKTAYPMTEFHVIGFIEPTEEIYHKKLAALQERGIILYHGNQKDVRPFIGRSHGVILPSVYGEGISNVLLESAASGRVLFTTDNPGCRDAVDNGSTGYIFPKNDVDTLCQQIQHFLSLNNDARKEMGFSGRQKMVAEFSRDYVVQAYLQEVERILE